MYRDQIAWESCHIEYNNIQVDSMNDKKHVPIIDMKVVTKKEVREWFS